MSTPYVFVSGGSRGASGRAGLVFFFKSIKGFLGLWGGGYFEVTGWYLRARLCFVLWCILRIMATHPVLTFRVVETTKNALPKNQKL